MNDETGARKLNRKPDREAEQWVSYLQDRPEKLVGPTELMWLGGFKSDMTGTKADALSAWAQTERRALTRFDYFGHGLSSGDFIKGTIGRWVEDALAVFDELTDGPVVLVGSSMGGWIALLVALVRPDRVKGLVLIAPAADFTEALMWAGFSDEVKATLKHDGVYREPSDYSDEPYEISWALIEEGRKHLLLNGPIAFAGPVRILQGMRDESVPWAHAMRLVEALTSDDVEVHLSKAGDHRLSTEDDLVRLMAAVAEVLGVVEG